MSFQERKTFAALVEGELVIIIGYPLRSLRIFFHLVYRRLMQFVQRVHNLHVSVDQ